MGRVQALLIVPTGIRNGCCIAAQIICSISTKCHSSSPLATWQASHLFVGVLEVIGLHDGKHTWTVTNSSVETLNDPLRLELGCDPHLLFEVRANLVEICKGACRV